MTLDNFGAYEGKTSRRWIRAAQAEDTDAMIDIWYRAGKLAYPFLPLWVAMTTEIARSVFLEHIALGSELWIGEDEAGLVAYMALLGDCIDRLYVAPEHQREGWGRALVDHARSLHPEGLSLFTHQENHGACKFYESLGFTAVQFGTSPPPESAPDVKYEWKPSAR